MSGSNQFAAQGTFTNWGAIIADSPQSSLGATATNFVNGKGGRIVVKGDGARFTVNGDLSNDGDLSLGSSDQATVAQNFVQASTGELSTQVSAASTFGSLRVSGHAALAGHLNVDRLPPYTPHVGDTQEILSAASVKGRFNAVTGAGSTSGSSVSVSYCAQGVALVAHRA